MRLIDADALKKWTDEHYDFEEFAVGYFVKIIQDIPTVDAVPVIRCKDCAKRTFTKCQMAIGRQSDYDFCSRAERKEKWLG